MIKVLLVDDHMLIRTGLRRVLEDTPDIRVAGEASSGEEALVLAEQLEVDVFLMDVVMPGIGGLEATRRLLRKNPERRVVVLSVHVDGPLPRRLLEAGAIGYVTKDCSSEEMAWAIRTAFRGQPYISRDVAQNMAMRSLSSGPAALETLSERELQVMLMVSQGLSNQDIADRLFMSPKTVSTYRSRVFRKLGVSGAVELTHLALRYGMIDRASESGRTTAA